MSEQPQPFHGMSLHVSVTVAPENASKFLAEFRKCFDIVSAEPECTYFELYQDPDTPGHFKWVENWSKDKEWFMKEQITKEYYRPYLEATEPMFVKPREFAFLDRMGPGWTRAKAENLE